MKRVFLYGGQGSQYFQMGRELYVEDPAFRAAFDHYDAMARVHRRRSLASVVYGTRPAHEPFEAIEDTQFAIPVVQLALTDMLDFKGYAPDEVMGTSLGEYTALVVSGQLSADALFNLLALQVRLLRAEFDACEQDPDQGMVSVFVSDRSQAEQLATLATSRAGRVGADTIVFGGSRPLLDHILQFCSSRGLLAHRLPVGYAFHTALMDRIRAEFLAICPGFDGVATATGFTSCVIGSPSTTGAERLFDILRRPFDFHAAFTALPHEERYHIADLSPAGIYVRPVAAVLRRQGHPDSRILPLLPRFGSDLVRLAEYQLDAPVLSR